MPSDKLLKILEQAKQASRGADREYRNHEEEQEVPEGSDDYRGLYTVRGILCGFFRGLIVTYDMKMLPIWIR